jgi:hypothetical protein
LSTSRALTFLEKSTLLSSSLLLTVCLNFLLDGQVAVPHQETSFILNFSGSVIREMGFDCFFSAVDNPNNAGEKPPSRIINGGVSPVTPYRLLSEQSSHHWS